MNDEKKSAQTFDPFKDVKDFFYERYKDGNLPVLLMVFVMFFNLSFFNYPTGYELYLLLPIIGTVIMIISQYWNRKENRKLFIISFTSLCIASGVDILVSVTYSFGSSFLRPLAIPTLIADVVAVVSYIGWKLDIRTKVTSNNSQTSEDSMISDVTEVENQD